MNSLLYAMKAGDSEKAFSLLSKTSNLNEQDSSGLTALHFACLHAQLRMVKALLNAGANPNILMTNPENMHENTEDDSELIWEEHLTLQMMQHLKDLGNFSPLHIAVRDRRLHICRLLLEHGADVNIEDFGQCTPLHWASNNGDIEMVELLLAYGAKVNVQDMAESTPLHEAVRKANLTLVKRLLAEGADPYLKDVSWQSPFDLAGEFPNILKLLLAWTDTGQMSGPVH